MSDELKEESKSPAAKLTSTDKRALTEKYIPYVRSIAGKIKKSVSKEIEYEDLVEYGMIGLLEAADRFDEKHGVQFMTFAYYRIRGAIYDGLRGMGWMSRTEYAKARLEIHANEFLSETANSEYESNETLENNFENAVKNLADVVQSLAVVYISSLDSTTNLQLKDDETKVPEAKFGLEQVRSLVRQSITKLDVQEKQLLELYYYKDMSLEEVGEILGLSKSWVSRLHARAVNKLHRMLMSEFA
ncbi:MAG: sigma-70 family RNA polymerase sigma factor [Deltaproteobacteria bacterium]|nr:sigma-70 family RNA polymerase sigma factor [Deltaproteobacteria bacterium]